MKSTICAELGQNWNGDYDMLVELAKMSFRSGCDLIKLQLRTPEICVPGHQKNKPRVWLGEEMTYLEYRRRLEITECQLIRFSRYIEREYGPNRLFASVWDIPSVERLLKIDPPYIKLPSAMITNKGLLQVVKDTERPIILSTGMSTESEIDFAVNFLGDSLHTILACTSTYPTPDDEVSLNRMGKLKKRYAPYRIGFSSHHISPLIPCYAMVLGAKMVEAHVTLGRHLPGSDQSSSLEEPGLSLLCREARRIPKVMGDGNLNYFDSELGKRKSLRGE